MPSIRFDPIEEFEAIHDRLTRAFEEILLREQKRPGRTSYWTPLVDIYETEHALILHAELPGIDQDNIEIEIRGNSLALRGNRQFLGEGKLENYHRIERAYGTFERYFTLPDSIDITKITAKFKDGVLTLTIPKIEETLSRRIEIIVE